MSCLAAVVIPSLKPHGAEGFAPWLQIKPIGRGAAPPILTTVPASRQSADATGRPVPSASTTPSTHPPATSAPTATTPTATAGPAVTQGAGGTPSPPPGFTTVFSDDFNGPAGSAPSRQNWLYDLGTTFGSNQVDQTNSTSNTHLDGNGDLVIQANNNGGQWTAAEIETTRDDFAAPPGGKLEMTASIQQPNPANATGYWPAFWAGGTPIRNGGPWPQSGEIDMMEGINGLNQAAQTFHFGSSPSTQLGGQLVSCPDRSSTCQTGFHTYTVIIDRTNTSDESLQFLMDGQVQGTYTEAQVGTSTWQAAIDHGFFILLDVVLGGTWPDAQCGCTSPTSATSSGGAMLVGYVAVYQQAAG